jgi:hypothetical protein
MIVPAHPSRFSGASKMPSVLSGDGVKSLLALIGIVLVAIAISPTASDGSRIFLDPGNLTDILRCFWQLHLAHFGNLIWPTHD